MSEVLLQFGRGPSRKGLEWATGRTACCCCCFTPTLRYRVGEPLVGRTVENVGKPCNAVE